MSKVEVNTIVEKEVCEDCRSSYPKNWLAGEHITNTAVKAVVDPSSINCPYVEGTKNGWALCINRKESPVFTVIRMIEQFYDKLLPSRIPFYVPDPKNCRYFRPPNR